LPASDSQIPRRYYVLVGVWLISMVAAFSYIVQQRLVSFDPQFTLLNAPTQELLSQLADVYPDSLSRTIFHFYDDGCHCTTLTAEHRVAIDVVAKLDNFNVVYVDVSSRALMNIIPASPAILITDTVGDLLYVGPYATGLDCSANNSLIDVVLNNFRQGFSLPTIISDAKGCYCQR